MDAKQVIVIRKDLNMRKGKMCAQAAHASMKVFFDRLAFDGNQASFPMLNEAETSWIRGHFTKIVVSVNSEQELMDVYEKAIASGLPAALVRDSGRTEFNGVLTLTAVAVGPAESPLIDSITGHLPLL